MHLLFRETHSLDEIDVAVDLGQSPADMVFLSFADTDLAAATAACRELGDALPSLRLANIGKLRHPLSVDVYVEEVIARSHAVAARLLGGLDFWRYGIEEIARICTERGIPLALVPGDGRPDPRLAGLSTVAPADLDRLDRCFAEGGPHNVGLALARMAHLAGLRPAPKARLRPVPPFGEHALAPDPEPCTATAAVLFYRAYLLAGDIAPLTDLAARLAERGIRTVGLYVGTLKDAETAAFVTERLEAIRPDLVLNATAFSARRDDAGSPLDAAGVPVLQLMLAGSSREAWAESARGLSQSDLAMQIVLPELDGRLSTTAISFKSEEAREDSLEYARTGHAPDPQGIALAAEQAARWIRLAQRPRGGRRIGLVLSDYPAAGQLAHAIGLDTIESGVDILALLREAGYDAKAGVSALDLVEDLCNAPPRPVLDLDTYRRLFATLPEAAQARILEAWGAPEDDPAIRDGRFCLRHGRYGRIVAAIQPDRGRQAERKALYHDADIPPRHAYVAFYLWLRCVEEIDAMIHLGAHGTLEWLPGKAVAVSEACFPAALLGGIPVAYPFIVNNPGEAAAAKRRLGAVTIGHLTPPLKAAGSHGAGLELERLIDEYAGADGLDRRRTGLLRGEILERAETLGLLEECGAGDDLSDDDRLARLDTYLCDVKDLQIRDGLHVFGRVPAAERRTALLSALQRHAPEAGLAGLEERLDACAAAERRALLDTLDGRFVEPGPSGAPTRGRGDVLPTGRNMFTVDPRAVPTHSAMVLARRTADELIRRHLQEKGEWPRALMIDLWGSATMRTGGEDLALALVLVGAEPEWNEGAGRVTGFEIVPADRLGRPRVDVTLRVSGLFRDAFEAQIAMFDAVVRAIGRRQESAEVNPLAGVAGDLDEAAFRKATARIYGSAPGAYGAGVSPLIESGIWSAREDLGGSYLAASASAYGQGLDGRPDPEGFTDRVRNADALIHAQDHRDVDLLDSTDFAAHEGGFLAAANRLGAQPGVYHLDTADPGNPQARTLTEEIARIVRGRAANPAWIAGMMRHGYRGGAEIARSLDGVFAFAATMPDRLDRQFDLIFDATLGDRDVDAFLRENNPAARGAMVGRFNEALDRSLWQPRRNSTAAVLRGDVE